MLGILGGRHPLSCGPGTPFWFIKKLFLEYHAMTRQQTMMEKEMFFLNSLQNFRQPTAVHKCDAKIHLIKGQFRWFTIAKTEL